MMGRAAIMGSKYCFKHNIGTRNPMFTYQKSARNGGLLNFFGVSMESQGAESDEDDDAEAVQALMDLHLEVSELDVPGMVAIPMLVTNAELIASALELYM